MRRQSVKLGGGRTSPLQRQQGWRWIRMAMITVVVIAIMVVGLAVAYMWYSGQQEPVVQQEVAPTPARTRDPAPPPAPAEDAPISIVQQTLLSPVAAGSNTALSIKTLPGAACSIIFTYNQNEARSRDSGLMPKTADEFGMLEWTWTVTADVQPGVWPAEVTCALNEKTAYLRADIMVE